MVTLKVLKGFRLFAKHFGFLFSCVSRARAVNEWQGHDGQSQRRGLSAIRMFGVSQVIHWMDLPPRSFISTNDSIFTELFVGAQSTGQLMGRPTFLAFLLGHKDHYSVSQL